MSEDFNEEKYSYKAAHAGEDIGKPGKNFAKIAKSAGEKYGSAERGKKVAGAILAKIRAKHGVHEAAGETYDTTTHTPTAVKSIKKFKGNPPVHPVATHEEAEQNEGVELSETFHVWDNGGETHDRYSVVHSSDMKNKNHQGHVDMLGMSTDPTHPHGFSQFTSGVPGKHLGKKIKFDSLPERLQRHVKSRYEINEETEADQLDTSLSDIVPGKEGEIYKKTSEKSTAPSKPTGTTTHVVAGKTGEAYNTTGITKRVPALESAIADVMAESFRKRALYEEAANISIVTPEQRQDWMNVEMGKLNFMDYLDKYKV